MGRFARKRVVRVICFTALEITKAGGAPAVEGERGYGNKF